LAESSAISGNYLPAAAGLQPVYRISVIDEEINLPETIRWLYNFDNARY
jgi:hypothetical protein